MKVVFKILFVILIAFTFSCQNSEIKKPKKQLASIEFGKYNNQNDNLGVELELSKFKNFRELLNRTEEVACNDSLPKVNFRTERKLKTVYFYNPCWDRYLCIFIKQKNTIRIHNDTITKSWDLHYPLDSLENVLRRDIENYGENPMLADNPKKLLIYISYDSNGLKKLPETLDKLTEAYYKITDTTNINIWLDVKFDVPPPPPPFNEPEYIEEIKYVE
ncbi:hypothetical protein [Costertonia aggregata]|uniref:Lipoprotein n=1 Tax=Costertonia aggregata TaxID=343403 RepID=A0A7H9AU85_9FLAO|nr:hypothetical protein [Costertonia aggregata]QLG46996.1 hypothetical protein HYG79_17085 [Costertonia aggregata]